MRTIMFVNDNEPRRDALSRRLERHGYRFQPLLTRIEWLLEKTPVS